MLAKDYRRSAWDALSGKWTQSVLVKLLMSIALGASGGLSVIGVGAVIVLLIQGPLNVGYHFSCLKVARGGEADIQDLVAPFHDFKRTFLLELLNGIFIVLWSLLFIIPGIIKAYSYSMSYFILIDNPEMTQDDARRASIEMMKGNKWRLFCLQFSFIGWQLLSVLTLGILVFWVQPYLTTATALFYESIKPQNEIPEQNEFASENGDTAA